jgi:hypothetical protein
LSTKNSIFENLRKSDGKQKDAAILFNEFEYTPSFETCFFKESLFNSIEGFHALLCYRADHSASDLK